MKRLYVAVLVTWLTSTGAAGAQIRPQDDLYQAANGHWLQSTPIPADKAVIYGSDLPGVADARVRSIIAGLSNKPQVRGSLAQKIADMHRSVLDTDAIDAAGLAPIQPLLSEIGELADLSALAAWQGRMQGRLTTPIWLWGGFADFQDPTLNRVLAWQGGLGMPDRNYYLDQNDPRLAATRAAYLDYLRTLARLAGMAPADQVAATVMALEQRLAQAHVSADQARDPSQMYHPLTALELEAAAPGFDWSSFISAARLRLDDRLTVAQLPAAKAIATLYREVPLADWKLYFQLHSLMEAAPLLPAPFRAAHFAFTGSALAGMTHPEPRWKSALNQVNAAFGEGIGQLYVERFFSPAAKARVTQMVASMRAAYRAAIAASDWMSVAAKAQALAKLDTMRTKIGYPERWTDYRSLEIRPGDALGNRQRAQRFAWERHATAAGGKVEREAWMMTPQTVNAYYDPMLNEIVLPAGILQAPLFDMRASDASNYGGIGATIGHELSHAFDSMGRQFDSTGRMRDWFEESDRRAFDNISAQLIKQFSAYQPLAGKPIDGKLTLPENLADLAGLDVALRAYRSSLQGKEGRRANSVQAFFLAYARSLRAKTRDARLLELLSSDPHAPHAFRVNGPARNLDGFHEAFQTRPGDAMYQAPAERIRIW